MSGVSKLLTYSWKILFWTNSSRILFQLWPKRKDLQVNLYLCVESKILNAQAEVESAKLMRQTADILSGKAAMQIRYLEALKGIASNPGVKVVFLAEE